MKRIFCIFISTVFLLLGCGGNQLNHTNVNNTNVNKSHNIERDSLSYGLVNAKVQKGKTQQSEIIKLFGPPNITTINSSGEEIWVYDRISTSSSNEGYSEAASFNNYFTLGLWGTGQRRKNSQYGNRSSNSTRTLTVIITFDKDKLVKDYSARATQF